MDCDYINEDIYITHGSFLFTVNTRNDTWKWNLATNTWTKLITSSPVPNSRTEVSFKSIPGTSQLLLLGGVNFNPPSFSSIILRDIWIFDTLTLNWTELTVSHIPDPYPEVFALAVTSDNYFIIHGGDAQGNLTVADTCKPPLQCLIPATPTDNTFVVKLENTGANWREMDFSFNTPPLRRASMVVFPPRIYLVGGYGWDGEHGVGEIYNPYTWVTELKQKFFD